MNQEDPHRADYNSWQCFSDTIFSNAETQYPCKQEFKVFPQQFYSGQDGANLQYQDYSGFPQYFDSKWKAVVRPDQEVRNFHEFGEKCLWNPFHGNYNHFGFLGETSRQGIPQCDHNPAINFSWLQQPLPGYRGCLAGSVHDNEMKGSSFCPRCGDAPMAGDRGGTGMVCPQCGFEARGNIEYQARPAKRKITKRTNMICSNCSTSNTCLWRRTSNGESVCNACGLYKKMHRINRPLSLRKDTIQRRRRRRKTTSANPKKKLEDWDNSGFYQESLTISQTPKIYRDHSDPRGPNE